MWLTHVRFRLSPISDEEMATLKRTRGQDYGEAAKFPVFGRSRLANA